ncbi:RNA 2',3'-cyclic phosphodiesterase [Vineibacter terrae]|uniref:RNA 2',3'-cyclic phosphodiesterase n=1 Tax=Vineibacter terrae TaxID=2586908 RepID=UPI002E31349F|nr:RNA 2',3'-cyclic phosphodiesterase [Vineibacter terrae]HEX2886146.1 RNA 2',3'-cyclic phosphodiesterase [Vineibacter terrae]
MPRLFVALPLPEDVADDLATLQEGIPDAAWVPSDNFHVTLAFIGSVDGGLQRDIAEALGTIDGPVLDLEIAGVDHFVEGRTPKVLYATVAPNPGLLRLQEKVSTVLRGEGVTLDRRKFRPHVSLARFNRRAEMGHHIAQFAASNNLRRFGPFEVDCFRLYASHTRPDGAVYTVEAEYPLGY